MSTVVLVIGLPDVFDDDDVAGIHRRVGFDIGFVSGLGGHALLLFDSFRLPGRAVAPILSLLRFRRRWSSIGVLMGRELPKTTLKNRCSEALRVSRRASQEHYP